MRKVQEVDLLPDLQRLGLVVLAGGLGAVIGLEREISDKPAGLRTHIFVCAGATLIMLLGNVVLDSFEQHETRMVNADPTRVIHAIVIGIGFLGAGTIFHQGGNRVQGLTTAASVFLTAGIGVAVAVGHIILAVGTTVFAVTILGAVGWLEFRLTKKN